MLPPAFARFAVFVLLACLPGCATPTPDAARSSDARLEYIRLGSGIQTNILRIDGQRHLTHRSRPELRLSPGGHFLQLKIEAEARVLGYLSSASAAFGVHLLPHRRYRLEVETVADRFEITIYDITDDSQPPAAIFQTAVPAAHRHPGNVSGKLG